MNHNEQKEIVIGNKSLNDRTAWAFQATFHYHQTVDVDGNFFEYPVVDGLLMPADQFVDVSFISKYDPSNKSFSRDETNAQRENEASSKEKKAFRTGHAHTPSVQANITNPQGWKISYSGDPRKKAVHCIVHIAKPNVQGQFISVYDGGKRRSLHESFDLIKHSNFVSLQLVQFPIWLEKLQLLTINWAQTPLKKDHMSMIAAELLDDPEGRKLLMKGNALGLLPENAEALLLQGEAFRVAEAIRRNTDGQILSHLICSVNERQNSNIQPGKGKRTIGINAVIDIQTGKEGRQGTTDVKILKPPASFVALNPAIKVETMQTIFSVAAETWPEIIDAWINGDDDYTLTKNRGFKALLAFCWSMMNIIEESNPGKEFPFIISSSTFWESIISDLSIAIAEGLSSKKSSQFWNNGYSAWNKMGGNSSNIGHAVREMEDSIEEMFEGGVLQVVQDACSLAIQPVGKKEVGGCSI